MIARSSVWKKFGVGYDGTERTAPPAIRNPANQIGRIAHPHRTRLWDRVDDRALQRMEEIRRRLRRHRADGTARHQKSGQSDWPDSTPPPHSALGSSG